MTTDQGEIAIVKSYGAERDAKIAELLKGAVDLHCHSGPAAMPRILDHHDATMDAEAAGFRALVFKDHYYVGMSHCAMIEKLVPDLGVKLYSGIALNNPSGGINPHAVDHAIKTGGQIVWMPTLAAENHIAQNAKATKNFPASAKPMLKAIPLGVLDANGNLTDDTLKILDLIAADDIILAGGHLHVSEQWKLFEEAIRRGVKKMLVNHPTYVVEFSDEDIRSMAGIGVHMEHSICMFVDGRGYKHDGARLKQLIDIAGVDKTLLCSDLGLTGSPRPVEGYRRVVNTLIDQGFADAQIRALTGENSARLLPAHA